MAIITIRIPPPGTALRFSSSKDPSDVFDYAMDFKQLLQSDTINTATVTSTEVTIDSSSVSGNVVTFFVSGGTNGNSGVITVKIVTSNATPRTFERSFKIKVEDI